MNAIPNSKTIQVILAIVASAIIGVAAFFVTRLLNHEAAGHASSLIRISRLENDVKEIREGVIFTTSNIRDIRDTQIKICVEMVEIKGLLNKEKSPRTAGR
jgi:hypothetical protein